MPNALKAPVPGTDPLASDVAQLSNLFNALLDAGLLQLTGPQSTPGAPTAAASGTSGNLNGAYLWKVVLITGWKQSDGSYYVSGFAPSSDSASVTVTNNSANLSSIATGTAVVIGRVIYRTAAGGAAGTEKFVGVIWDNTSTTFTDNVADANIGTGMPTSTTNPAAYGTPIPAALPTTNTTGTRLSGVSSVVTSVRNEEITSTAATTIITFTPTTSGMYSMKVYLRVVTAATNITLTTAYADSGGNQSYTPAALNNISIAAGSHSVIAYDFEAVAGTPITLTITAGTANQVFVTASLVEVG